MNPPFSFQLPTSIPKSLLEAKIRIMVIELRLAKNRSN